MTCLQDTQRIAGGRDAWMGKWEFCLLKHTKGRKYHDWFNHATNQSRVKAGN